MAVPVHHYSILVYHNMTKIMSIPVRCLDGPGEETYNIMIE